MEFEKLKYFESLQLKGNALKDIIQTDIINTWLKDFNGIGVFKGYTGFGKTEVARKLIRRYKVKFTDKIIIVVPTDSLYNDWVATIQAIEYPNWEVYVINTYTMNEKVDRNCALILIDEIHHCLGKNSVYFSTLIKKTKYKRLLGLSATLSHDEIKYLEDLNIEICYEITINDGIKLNLLPPFEIINVGVDLSYLEQLQYYRADKLFNEMFTLFMSISPKAAFDLVMACSTDLRVDHSIEIIPRHSNNGSNLTFMLTGSGDDIATYVAENSYESKQDVIRKACMCRSAMSERLKILQDSENKYQKALQILQKTKLKSITFSLIIPFITRLNKELGGSSILYHSKIADGKRKKILEAYSNDAFQHLLSAKALEEGTNVKNIQLGLNTSYTSKDRAMTQKLGRILRLDEKNPDKSPVMINLYHNIFEIENDDGNVVEIKPNDLKNLLKIQESTIDVKWIDNIDELNI